MGLQPGERQTQRTKEALLRAFVELIHEKNYQAISINAVVERANMGRSTFYRHFQSKADLLLSLHEGIFDRLDLGLSSASAWLANEPPPQLVVLLQRYQQYENTPVSFLSGLGNDVDYVVPRMEALLSRQVEKSLHHSFAEEQSNIPFSVLARSIAATYSWLMRSWLMERRTLTPAQVAGYIHRLTRAAIQEAFACKDELHPLPNTSGE